MHKIFIFPPAIFVADKGRNCKFIVTFVVRKRKEKKANVFFIKK